MLEITATELKKVTENNEVKNFAIIDVRSNLEYKTGKIEGAYNIPLDEIQDNLEMLKQFDTIYVHCKSGYRSLLAYQKLVELGFKNVFNVKGGITDWQQQGFEVKI